MNIFYLIFGPNISNHLQAHLSILTFMRQMEKGDNIYVVTTNPDLYSDLENVNVIPISDETIKEWEGKHHFFWRVKIKAIEHVAEMHPDAHLMYLDSDTVLRPEAGSLNAMRGELDKGFSLMHVNEGHPRNMKTKSLRMWKRVGGRTYGGITIGEAHNMWNAGVVGIPAGQILNATKLALSICDGMLDDDAERVVIEQYALSIALQETTKLMPAHQWIDHYWGNKEEWNQLATQFMLEAKMKRLTPKEEIQLLNEYPFGKLPLLIRKPNTQRRLTNIVKKLFPDEIQTRQQI